MLSQRQPPPGGALVAPKSCDGRLCLVRDSARPCHRPGARGGGAPRASRRALLGAVAAGIAVAAGPAGQPAQAAVGACAKRWLLLARPRPPPMHGRSARMRAPAATLTTCPARMQRACMRRGCVGVAGLPPGRPPATRRPGGTAAACRPACLAPAADAVSAHTCSALLVSRLCMRPSRAAGCRECAMSVKAGTTGVGAATGYTTLRRAPPTW